jgi:hypothetical protein
LKPLTKAAQGHSDPEVRRRAKDLLEAMIRAPIEESYRQGVDAYKVKKDYRKALAALDRARELGERRWQSCKRGPENWDDLLLSDIYLEMARVQRTLDDCRAANRAYERADYYSNYSPERRRQIAGECDLMVAELMVNWEQSLRKKGLSDPNLKALLAQYPLVLLNSRRFARANSNSHWAYSFVCQSADKAVHRNDVQVSFEPFGDGSEHLRVYLVVGQRNVIADLGDADFVSGPAIAAKVMAQPTRGSKTAPVKQGHLYLEHVLDNRGSDFLVLIKVVALGDQQDYVAFVWQRIDKAASKRSP